MFQQQLPSRVSLTGYIAIVCHTQMPDGQLGFRKCDGFPSAKPLGYPFNRGATLQPTKASSACLSGSTNYYTQLWQCSGMYNDDNQNWQFKQVNDAYCQIIIQTSKWCLDVENASLTSGATVIAYECKQQDNQLWRVEEEPGVDGFLVINKASGLCAAPQGDKSDNGAVIVQAPCSNDRRWYIREVFAPGETD